MEKLIAELRRLYLPDPQHPSTAALEDHLHGSTTLTVDLAGEAGTARAMALDFPRAADDRHWLLLCDVANALQQDLTLPAPAVSVNGADRFTLWLSFSPAQPLAQLRRFRTLLQQAYCPDLGAAPDATEVALPPCRHQASGLWAAFINPAMGAALADDLGLELPPPVSAQAAFLQGLDSISAEQFAQALQQLELQAAGPAAEPAPPTAQMRQPAPAGVLLGEATLEQIVAELHRRQIEPTLRHVIGR
ncbi:hypothetical protein ASF61_04155 [Duganella sp. Leaf126]|uniref:hypothetical protein n=1 Tax=Duganella sp. Leaf126 TaxID=1736266 RepID=UPI0007016E9E|nr:hypothetical protein [Duganella sp. Leaf126]KQQ40006.1 hypothetical protein ASF61_04155 [Duganella sp. Leaf126]